MLGGGNSNILYFHPELCGRWTHFDEHIFQMGWFNHQLEWFCSQFQCLTLMVHWWFGFLGSHPNRTMQTEVASGMSFLSRPTTAAQWSWCRVKTRAHFNCTFGVVKVWVKLPNAGPKNTQGHRVFKKCDWLAEEGLVHHCTIGPQGKVRTSSQADGRIWAEKSAMAFKVQKICPTHGKKDETTLAASARGNAVCCEASVGVLRDEKDYYFVPGMPRGIQREHATKDEFLDARTIIWHLSDIMRNNVASVRKYEGPIKTWSFSSAFVYLAHQVLETTEKVTRIHSLDLTSVPMIHSLG